MLDHRLPLEAGEGFERMGEAVIGTVQSIAQE